MVKAATLPLLKEDASRADEISPILKPVTSLVQNYEQRAMANAYLGQLAQRKDLDTVGDVLDAIAFDLKGDPMAVYVAFKFGAAGRKPA